MLLLSLVLARRDEGRPLEVYVQLYQQQVRKVWEMELQMQKGTLKLDRKFTKTFEGDHNEEMVRKWMLENFFHLIEYKNIPKYINLVLYADPKNLQMAKVGKLKKTYEIKLRKQKITVNVELHGHTDTIYNYLLKLIKAA